MMFIDSDIRFNPNDLVKMIEADKDIICGLYPKKEINFPSLTKAIENNVKQEDLKYYTGSFVVNLVGYAGETVVPLNDPVEIWNGGTGFMLIKREVFEKLEPFCPKYALNGQDASFDFNSMVTEFFATSITEEGILLSEDYHFCRLYRKHGGQVYAAPWVQVDHAGEYIFSGRFAQDVMLNGTVSERGTSIATPVDSLPLSDTTVDHSESGPDLDSDRQQSSDKKAPKPSQK
jgi:hypothetical protein